jgi:hypothetical protein
MRAIDWIIVGMFWALVPTCLLVKHQRDRRQRKAREQWEELVRAEKAAGFYEIPEDF